MYICIGMLKYDNFGICMYINLLIYMHIQYIDIWVYIYIYIYIYIYVCMYVSVYVYISNCSYLYMRMYR